MEPDVHHIKPVRDFDEPQEAHEMTNLITLCKRCHTSAEWGTIPTPDPYPDDNTD